MERDDAVPAQTQPMTAHADLRDRVLNELNARIAAIRPPGDEWNVDQWTTRAESESGKVGVASSGLRVASGMRLADAAHAAAHSPGRMLRLYGELRALADAHEPFDVGTDGGGAPFWTCRACDSCTREPCSTTHALAAALLDPAGG